MKLVEIGYHWLLIELLESKRGRKQFEEVKSPY
jgi:hypothetical protein